MFEAENAEGSVFLNSCKTGHFFDGNLCIFDCDKILQNIFLRFLLLVYRQSIEQLNFCDRPKILKNAKN